MDANCVLYINRALALAEELLALANEGDAARDDKRCGVLYGTLRDCGYKIRAQAESELRTSRK